MPSFTVPPDAQTALLCGHCGDEIVHGPTTATEQYGDVCAVCAAELLPRCAHCGDIAGDDLTEDIYRDDYCGGCVRSLYGWNACAACERPGHSYDLSASDNGYICGGCAGNRYWECARCDYLISSGTYCEDCDGEQEEESDYVHSYNYTPSPNFHGDGPTYLGFELEINTPRGGLDDTARTAIETLGPLGYLKEDSTIEHGFEIVTHPMSHAWASKHFPWELLTELRRMECRAEQFDGGLGLHVHVSRAGFDGPAHVLRWLRLMYRNSNKVAAIARRDNNEWAAWSRTNRRKAKDHAKGDRAAMRYSAINVQNFATFEVRVFASTLDRTELRAALDLVAASVEYTRELTVRAIVDGGWTWDAFAGYVAEHPTYAALHSMITEGT